MQHGPWLRHVLKHARRYHRVEAAGRERERAPRGIKPDPAHALRLVSQLGLAEHLRCDVAAGHPVAGARQVPRQLTAAAAEIEQLAALADPVPDRLGELCQPSGQRPLRCVLGWPAGRLRVEEPPYPVRVVLPGPGRVPPGGPVTHG